jgi:hypothetical protein
VAVQTQTENWRPVLDRFQRMALIVGAAGMVISVLGAFLGPAQFFHSLIFSFFFWMTLTIGAAIMLMIQYLTGGVWGLILRRMLESAIMTLPLMLVVFLVLCIGIPDLYEWSHPEVVAESEVLQFKAVYLNTPFFIARGIFYFAALILIAFILNRWSSAQDKLTSREESEKLSHRMARLAGPGIPVFVLIWTLASTDWGMSLEPEWFSSMYPVTFIIEGMLATFAWGILGLAWMRSRKLLPYSVPTDRLHDLGKFMFAFTIVWTYINFSQFLIIWSGNIPEEVTWYTRRTGTSWNWLILFVLAFQFILPFLVLLSRRNKRAVERLSALALMILFVHMVEVFWLIIPAFHPEVSIALTDIAAPIGIGGIWVAALAWLLSRRALLPLHDPHAPVLQEAHHHG